MTFRPVRTFVQTFLRTSIGCCALAGVLASCSSSGVSGTGGSGGGSGGGAAATGGTVATGTGGSASGGASGVGSGGSAGGQAVGTPGGTVVQAGVTLTIPTSALSTSTVITVATTAAPSGYTLASEAYQFGPSGTTFAQPVAVTIPLTSATPGVHLFWSNASGGFDDVGGTVTGSSLTANVTHFSIGFCAIPKASGAGGSSATGGASGSGGGAGTTGGGGQATGGISGGTGGSAGTTGAGGSAGTTGAGGSAGTTGAGGSAGKTGAGGSAGTTGAGGGATDAGLSGDAAASLCKTSPLNLPFASISNVDAGVAPDSSAYTGGTIASGRYFLTSVTHYGGGSYTGSRQAQYTIDATAKTIVIGEFVPSVGGSQYVGMTYTEINANTLRATVVCNSGTTPSGTFDMYYTVTGSQITLTDVGSSDVSVL